MKLQTQPNKGEVSVITVNSSEFDKYNAFLKEALERCANLKTPYDRVTELPLTWEELDKFCDSARSLGLPVIYIAASEDRGYYVAYPTFEMLKEKEKYR